MTRVEVRDDQALPGSILTYDVTVWNTNPFGSEPSSIKYFSEEIRLALLGDERVVDTLNMPVSPGEKATATRSVNIPKDLDRPKNDTNGQVRVGDGGDTFLVPGTSAWTGDDSGGTSDGGDSGGTSDGGDSGGTSDGGDSGGTSDGGDSGGTSSGGTSSGETSTDLLPLDKLPTLPPVGPLSGVQATIALVAAVVMVVVA
jgi:hypothetical protein